MATSVEVKLAREEYLKKYLSGQSNSSATAKKKKRKKGTKTAVGIKIVEDDAFIAVAPETSKIPSDEDDREDLRREIEVSMKLAETAPKFKKGTFQAVSDSAGTEQQQRIHSRHDSSDEEDSSGSSHREIGQVSKNADVSPSRVWQMSPPDDKSSKRGVGTSDGLKRNRHDSSSSDVSVNRHSRNELSDGALNETKRCHDSDGDVSSKRRRTDSESDELPKRRPRKDSDHDLSWEQQGKRDTDGDMSPERQRNTDSRDDRSLLRGRRRHNSSDAASRNSQRRRGCHQIICHDNNLSPKRRRRDSGGGPTGKPRQHQDSDVDLSPRRRRRYDSGDCIRREPQQSRDSDTDLSPVRLRKNDSDNDIPQKERQVGGVDGDLSPVRRRIHGSDRDISRGQRRRNDSDSDLSPVRRQTDGGGGGLSFKRRSGSEGRGAINERTHLKEERSSDRKGIDSDDDAHEKRQGRSEQWGERDEQGRVNKTLDGKVAGLQSASAVHDEMQKLREKENKVLDNLDAELSGRNAEAVHRSKMTGKGRETREDKEKREREAKKQKELEEKYQQWNKGVLQIKQRAERLDEMARVVKEGFTRRADNEAMNEHMKEILLADDPMLEHVKKKKLKAEMKTGTVYPKYKGGWPPNRFSIPPGYRWDGVDRSNGFEARIAQTVNRKAAEEREYYQNISKYE